MEAIWSRILEDAEIAASDLNIPYATNQIDDVLLKKDVDLIIIFSAPAHHSQIAVKALGKNYFFSIDKLTSYLKKFVIDQLAAIIHPSIPNNQNIDCLTRRVFAHDY